MGIHTQKMNEAQIRQFKKAFLQQYIKEGFRLTNGRGRPYSDRDEFWRWMDSKDKRWPFSFIAICLELGINPVTLKNHLRYLQHKLTGLTPKQLKHKQEY